jgi:hypothetical protein
MLEAVIQKREKTVLISIFTAIYTIPSLIYLYQNCNLINILSFSGIFLGLISIIIGTYSLESTTDQLNLMQTDYWNVRGIDGSVLCLL